MATSKPSGPVPQAVRRRRNADELKPIPQGTRRGISIKNPQPSPHWRMDVQNYYRAVLASAAADWYEDSDLMMLTLQAELLDRVLRGARTVPVYKEVVDAEGNYVPVLDEDGEPIPELDDFGMPERRLLGSINGQALKSILDLSSELLVTEGSRRRLRIDLAAPQDDSEPAHKAIIAKQREDLQTMLKEKKSTK